LGDEYAGKAAEEIYAKLPEPPKGGGSGDGGKDWDVGHVYDNPDLAQGRSVKDVEAERNMKISNWYQSAKRAGKVPAELDRIVEEMMKARMPWREILARFVNTSACNDYDHTIPDPEYARYGVYMPSMHSEELGTIVHMGDTSGSISTDMFRIEVAEAQGMLRAYPGAQMLCLWIDTKVHNPEWITADDIPLRIHPAGGGGTSFRPGFDYLAENDIVPVCIIYATDGQCDDFPDDPGVPVLWLVIEDNESFNPPFGEVVRCDFE
jgi:predicted metal-dependent peptidase